MSVTDIRDEELHEIGPDRHWQESYYFNWADPNHDVFGLTRIGLRFHEQRVDGLILTIRNGKPEYVYPAVNLRQRNPWNEHSAEGGLQARNLMYVMEEPLRRWRLSLTGRNSMDLLWESLSPAFDYGESEHALPPNVAGRHFEQVGRVTGWTRFKGQELEINGLGQRDKSWGVRDWQNIEGWNWISVQLGEDLAFNVWELWYQGHRHINGFIFRDGVTHAVEKVEIELVWAGRMHVPQAVRISIRDASGGSTSVHGEALGHFPLVKEGLWIQETHARFTAESSTQQSHGVGVIEHAWRPSRLQMMARTPHLVGVAGRVLIP